MNEDAAWNVFNSVYCIGGSFDQWDATDEDAARAALKLVKELGVGQMVVDLAMESVWTALRREIVPVFWRTVCSNSCQNSDPALLTCFHDALQLLQSSVVVLAPLIKRCEEVCRDCKVHYTQSCNTQQFTASHGQGGLDKLPRGSPLHEVMMVQLRATLHSQMPAAAPHTLTAIYEVAFRIYNHLHLDQFKLCSDSSFAETSVDGCQSCAGCLRDSTQCDCLNLSNTFTEINRVTWQVGIAEELCSSVAAARLVDAVRARVSATCALPHDTHRLQPLLKWFEAAGLGWLGVVGSPQRPPPTTAHPLYRACHGLLIRSFVNTRIRDLFPIVIDHPESRPAIDDLRACMQVMDVHQHLVHTLRKSIQSRMLHPGVKTLNVLHAYTSIIRALKALEPRGAILDLVTEPVRMYLRSRKDFVRYIVTSLTDSGASSDSLELSDDVMDGDVPDDALPSVSDDEWRLWVPDSVYAQNKAKKSCESSSNDLISMLVDIYGSKDMFISEYRALFADRLLSSLDCSKATVEIETKHLEQIKKRFGTSSPYISKIEVMIRDMNVSRSVNSAVLEAISTSAAESVPPDPHPVVVACLIVSGLFWPAFKEENIELPERALQHIKRYDELFTKLKPNRKLSWKHHLGQVDLELELQSRTLEVKCTPGQAAVIMAFEDKSRLTLREVSLATKTTPSLARKLIAFWVGQGVVQEVSSDVFEVCEEGPGSTAPSGAPAAPPPLPVEDDNESAMAPSEMQRQEELEVVWSYILGMLTNLSSLPIERIHSMLKMFVEETVECTIDELRALLDQKVLQHELLMVNGQYKLNKS
ncbi:Anaphase-promoting complex subunit 2 C-terminal [Trinorchestia longiramus]|nr:Anaphase-promoting complex subunit 2 C-terminal [Trinorchestia longiramus]